MPIHICPGCNQHLDDDSLVWPIPDVAEKVLPGEPMPAGECPDCSTLVSVTDAVPIPGGVDLDENSE